MTPTIGDDDKLRDVLISARKAHNGGKGKKDDRLAQVAPLIEVLEGQLASRTHCRRLASMLLATLRRVPVMATDPMLGSEPLAHRWVVNSPEAFHRVIEQIRSDIPQELQP